jgi:DNA/RNA-binding domain of Phe-tRNA-synthetase-like protein
MEMAYPGAVIGILAMSPVQNTPPGADIIGKLHSLEREVRARHAGRSRRDLEGQPALRPYVEHYRRFGKTYHVLLQLESVAFRDRSLATGSALVNAMFAAEIESSLLTAGHDLEAVEPPLTADVTRAGERYIGVGERPVEVKPGAMSIRDTRGILSTVLYGPDHRTRLRPETRSVLFTTYAPSSISDSDLDRHLHQIESLVRVQTPLAHAKQLGIRRA